ncbi:MAG: VOC family protein [Chloroflexi bacterium]|nr:VOC family protein [Chloroflexota bacterium]
MPEYHTRLGHAHLKVRDLNRSTAFYTRYFNLRVIEQVAGQYAFLSGGELHHEIALQARGVNAPAQHPYGVGLYHVAFEVPDKQAFAQAYQLLRGDGVDVAAVDHLISWAMYFDDPDGNGLEIYCDTRREPDSATLWHGVNRPLPEAVILAALG